MTGNAILPPEVCLLGIFRTLGLERWRGWAISPNVAEAFAKGHWGISVPHPTVCRAVMKKMDTAFICGDRNEAEVVPTRECEIDIFN
jgi:hypothetical protein